MQNEKARNARIRATLDRLKAQYVRDSETLRELFDAAGLPVPHAVPLRWPSDRNDGLASHAGIRA
jgi:hypothetical protein